MGWPPIKLESLTSTYITSPIKSEPACAPSISSSPTTLQNWDTHVIWKTVSTPNWPPIKLGPTKWSDNGYFFFNKIWCPKSIFWVPLYSNYSIVLLEYVILYSSFYINISILFYIHHYLSYRFFMICSQFSILNQFWFYRGHSCLCIKDSNFKVGPIHPIPFHPQEMLRVVAINFDFIGLIFLHASQIPIL